MELTARYYDGRTSEARQVRLRFEANRSIRISDLNGDCLYLGGGARISPRIGNTPRSLFLPQGAKCETDDNDAIDAYLAADRRALPSRMLHMLESRLPYVLIATVITVACVWLTVEFAIPALAEHAARTLPASIDSSLGRGTLAALDKAAFQPSSLDDTVQSRIQGHFASMTRGLDDGHRFRLEFRRGGDAIGANAFALPSGIIVVTDELVGLARDDNEIVSVLAHELGHVLHRHALRKVMQESAAGLLIATVTGDVVSASSLAAALPAIVLHAKYSRSFETEADGYALDYLDSHGIPRHHFADILTRLSESHGNAEGMGHFLSSHPATSERVKLFASGG